MFKKSMILGLGVLLASIIPVASDASCAPIYRYESVAVSAKDMLGLAATGGGAVGSTFGKSYRSTAFTTGTAVAAGAMTITNQELNRHQLASIYQLLRESNFSNGLRIAKMTKKVQKLQELEKFRSPNTQSATTFNVALTINQLDEQNVFCMGDKLMSYNEIAELVAAHLK